MNRISDIGRPVLETVGFTGLFSDLLCDEEEIFEYCEIYKTVHRTL